MCVYIPYIWLSLCKRISRLQDICQRRIVRSMRPLLLIVATRTSSTQECNSIHNMHIVQVYISSRRLWCNTLNISQPIHSSSNDLRWKDWIRVKDIKGLYRDYTPYWGILEKPVDMNAPLTSTDSTAGTSLGRGTGQRSCFWIIAMRSLGSISRSHDGSVPLVISDDFYVFLSVEPVQR